MELFFRLKKSPEFVFEYLSDMQKFVSVHPVITQIAPKGNGCYLVYETLELFGIPFSFTYPALIEVHASEKSVIMRAEVMKLVKIHMHFLLSGDQEQTHIRETIQFRSLLPVHIILKRVFRKQHHSLFRNIEAL